MSRAQWFNFEATLSRPSASQYQPIGAYSTIRVFAPMILRCVTGGWSIGFQTPPLSGAFAEAQAELWLSPTIPTFSADAGANPSIGSFGWENDFSPPAASPGVTSALIPQVIVPRVLKAWTPYPKGEEFSSGSMNLDIVLPQGSYIFLHVSVWDFAASPISVDIEWHGSLVYDLL